MTDRKEYIERGALLDALTSEEAVKVLQHSAARAVCLKNVFDRIPAADVVEVVRCEECVFYQPEYSGFGCSGAPYDFGKCTRFEFLSDEINARSHNDYCSYGERKDGADNAAD